jgi:hypothetical protein
MVAVILLAVAVVAGPTAAALGSGHSEEARGTVRRRGVLRRRKRCLNLDRAEIVSTAE